MVAGIPCGMCGRRIGAELFDTGGLPVVAPQARGAAQSAVRSRPRWTVVDAVGDRRATRGHCRPGRRRHRGRRFPSGLPDARFGKRERSDNRQFVRGVRSGDHRSGPAPHAARHWRSIDRRPDADERLCSRSPGDASRASGPRVAQRARRRAGRKSRSQGGPLMMNRAWTLALILCAAACALLDRPAVAAVDETANRQILVMLRTAPPHFRPDVSYTGSYDSRIGRDARQRIAEGLASRHRLSIVTNWPMPALGVDCFVMAARADDSIARIVDEVAQDPSVESVQAMNLFNVLAHNDPLYPLQPSASAWHLADVHKVATGKRVKVAEVDTGVEINHPDLVRQIALARDFVDGQSEVAEPHG